MTRIKVPLLVGSVLAALLAVAGPLAADDAATITTYFEVWTSGDVDELSSAVSPQVRRTEFLLPNKAKVRSVETLDELMNQVFDYRDEAPDLKMTIRSRAPEGDGLKVEWTLHSGTKAIQGHSVFQFVGGLIVAEDAYLSREAFETIGYELDAALSVPGAGRQGVVGKPKPPPPKPPRR